MALGWPSEGVCSMSDSDGELEVFEQTELALFSCKTVLLSSAEVRLKQASGTKWKILQ